MPRLNAFKLVDLSKGIRHPLHNLKKHILYPLQGHELTEAHLHEHIGHHQTPDGHRVSIHHHDGKHSFYHKVFDTADAAKHHVKSFFKFSDMFPKTTDLAKKAYDKIQDVDYLGALEKYGETAGKVAGNLGFPELGGGLALAGDLASGYRKITDLYHEAISDLKDVGSFSDFMEKFPHTIDFGKQVIEGL
jgi:hypothetical protein